ncbi:G-protein coupled receptor 35-like [Tiliqua scincoides]|uniref:G-protein coupled receptor 35-like n=1 Tax=Tiliqua scincoides TaxID=71010 RepID=UPI003463543C
MNYEANCSINSHSTNSTISSIQTIVYIPVFIIGVILNALALKVFCCKLSKWTETRVYMTNLAIADCLLLFTLPLKIIYKTQVSTLCLILESAYFINRYMSIFLITITAVDRCFAISYPFKAKTMRSPLKSAVICGFLWALMISIICVTKLYEKRVEPVVCFKKVSREPSFPVFASVIWGFVIPLTILCFCSIQVKRKLIAKKCSDAHEEKQIQKAINIIGANMAVFIICFLPIHVAQIVRFIVDMLQASCTVIENTDIFVNLAGIIANTNCCLDAICYYFVNREFQEASLELISNISSSQKRSFENQEPDVL